MGSGTRQATARSGRSAAILRWSGLVFGLVTLHLALMTGEHHRATAAIERAADHVATVAALVAGPLDTNGDQDHPRSTLDGCPVGVAILPLLLALLALMGFAFARRAAALPTPTGERPLPPARSPPPLAAPQRRALLQIFLI